MTDRCDTARLGGSMNGKGLKDTMHIAYNADRSVVVYSKIAESLLNYSVRFCFANCRD